MTEPAHIELRAAEPGETSEPGEIAARQWRPGRGFIAGAAVAAALLAGVAAVYARQNAATTDAIRHDLDTRTGIQTTAGSRHTITFQANTGAQDAFIVDSTGLHDQQPVGAAVTAAGVVLVEVVAVSTGQAASCSISVDGTVVDREQAPGGPAAFTICLWRPDTVAR